MVREHKSDPGVPSGNVVQKPVARPVDLPVPEDQLTPPEDDTDDAGQTR
jgi:ChpA-C